MNSAIINAKTAIPDVADAFHCAGQAVARSVLMRPFIRVVLADELGPARIEVEPVDVLREHEHELELQCAVGGVYAQGVLVDGCAPSAVVIRGLDDGSCRSRQILDWARACVEANTEQILRVAQALLVNGELSPGDVFDAGAPFVVPGPPQA